MKTTLSETDYVFMPVDEAATPRAGGFFQHYVDAWWAVHPERGLMFYNPVNPRTGRRRHGRYGSPQCNTDKRISQLVCDKTVLTIWPDVRIDQFPSVWVPFSLSDF